MPSVVASNQKDAADTLGISERQFQRWQQEGCPGRPRAYVMSEIILWARENKWESDPEQKLIDSIDDEDLKNALIRKRIEKIERENRLADYKIEEKDESLIDVTIVVSRLTSDMQRLRTSIETVEKKCGPMSCDPIRIAIDAIITSLEKGFAEVDSQA